MIWHNATPQDVLDELDVDDKRGLTNNEVDERLQKYGQNVISKMEIPTFLDRFLSQLKNKTVIILIITALASFFVSLAYNKLNTFAPLLIIAIVIINALISAYQLFSCDKSIEDMKQVTNPSVNVLRDGILKKVNSVNLVPGDIILLQEGDYVPADARIIESNEFRVNESSFSGIEVPVEKQGDILLDDITPLENRENMLFLGTSVAHGNAKAVVVSTGLNTENGRTSAILQQTGEDKLPLQDELKSLSKVINTSILIICIAVFVIGFIQNFSADKFASMTLNSLMNSIALAVAAIPEGLPAITTIVIAIGMQRILKDKIIVKDASAAELLGKTNVICCDKTGVFTHNKMLVSKIFDGKQLYDLKNDAVSDSVSLVLKIATACSTLKNDSTEDAIKNANLAYNSMSVHDINALFPHITEIPFDSERKTMTVITMINERPFAIVKGAAETIIPKCIGCDHKALLKLNEGLANEAYRNVCIAMKPLAEIPANPTSEEVENELKFVGLISLDDPPREGIISEIADCDAAGIVTVMMTGDNINTAKAIARRIGILKDGTLAITGAELQKMSDEELEQNIEKYSLFARISPSEKSRIVKAWQKKGKIVTITGDSVQDADALALADVGCAIGKFGADVAKGNADIIISNNRFATIVNAVRESRGLFNNIKKSITYLFSCNLAEVLTFVTGLLLFRSAPVSAVLLLWINLLTDSAPAISLSMEGAEDTCMKTKNRSGISRILNKPSVLTLLIQSIVMTAVTLVSYSLGYDFGDTVTAMSMAFVTLALSQLWHCFNCKLEGTILTKKIFSNALMNYSVLIGVFIVLFLVFTPAGYVFDLKILSFTEFISAFGLSLIIVPTSEILKRVFNK